MCSYPVVSPLVVMSSSIFPKAPTALDTTASDAVAPRLLVAEELKKAMKKNPINPTVSMVAPKVSEKVKMLIISELTKQGWRLVCLTRDRGDFGRRDYWEIHPVGCSCNEMKGRCLLDLLC